MMLMKKGKGVGSKGSPLKNKSGWGGAGGGRSACPRHAHQERSTWAQVAMDSNKDKMNPNNR